MAGRKGIRPAPESLEGDHPAERGTGIRSRGGIIMPMVPPLSYRPPKAAVSGGFGEREDNHRPRRAPSCYARIRRRHAHMVAPGVATARNAR